MLKVRAVEIKHSYQKLRLEPKAMNILATYSDAYVGSQKLKLKTLDLLHIYYAKNIKAKAFIILDEDISARAKVKELTGLTIIDMEGSVQ